jgi:bifunctional DNA-binding transcriptional regulator/antitoxin component of YhaV-PrlF toxin-antitoxin module
MVLTFEAKVGKKYALYLPRGVVRALGLKEGGKVLLRVVGGTLTVQSVEDPIKLALEGSKFASVNPEKVERISLEHQQFAAKGNH